MYNNFIEDCLNEGTLLSEIDDYIEYWHNSDLECDLEEFIGLTEFESERWLNEGNGILREVLYCRRHNISYQDYLSMTTEKKIAARSYDLKDVKEYKNDKK